MVWAGHADCWLLRGETFEYFQVEVAPKTGSCPNSREHMTLPYLHTNFQTAECVIQATGVMTTLEPPFAGVCMSALKTVHAGGAIEIYTRCHNPAYVELKSRACLSEGPTCVVHDQLTC